MNKYAIEERNQAFKTVGISVLVVSFLVIIGSALVMNGLILGCLMTTGAYILLLKIPLKMKVMMVKYDLLTDAFFSIGSLFMFGGTTVTGMMAAAITGLLVSVILKLEKYKLIKSGKLTLKEIS